MRPSEWAATACESQHNQKDEDQEAIDLLELIMLGLLSPADTAVDIGALYEPSIRAKQHELINNFWIIFGTAARACGDDRERVERLADLIIAIEDLPDLFNQYGIPVRDKIGCYQYWKDMPEWGRKFRQFGIGDVPKSPCPVCSGPCQYPDEGPTMPDSPIPSANATAVAAAIHARTPSIRRRVEMLHMAIDIIIVALGTSLAGAEDHEQAELYMPAAATWIIFAGDVLLESITENLPGTRMRGLRPETWADWKTQLRAIHAGSHAGPDFNPANRLWAVDAVSAMDRIDRIVA